MRRHEDMGNDRDEGFEGRGPDGPQQVPPGGVSPRWIGAGTGAVLLLVLAIQNSERVDVDFLFFDAQVRVFTIVLVAAVLGFAVGWFIGRPSRSERKFMRRGMEDRD